MKLLYVVQRYGTEVAGGAEFACKAFATRLSARDHRVEVLTTCAASYATWENFYSEGVSEMNGLKVHRLPVLSPRDDDKFGSFIARMAWDRGRVPLHLQKEWMRLQGPQVPDLGPWLHDRAGEFDAVIFFTYLYYTAWAGLKAASGLTTTILHPTAHDEPPIYLPLFDLMFRLPSGLALFTKEEAELIQRRFRSRIPSSVIGIGTDLQPSADEASFRERYGLAERPYLVFVGRLDPYKGSDELFDFFAAYKSRNPGPLALVVVGEPVKPLPPHPDVIVTGFVEESVKTSALAGCFALVQPSYFESFSMVLTEAWALAKPALVQGHCKVLDGQVRRAGGGIPYSGYAEFEAALDMLFEDEDLRRELGEAGRRFVKKNYSWEVVLTRYERFLNAMIGL
ncbi:MAG: glycosyltransferase family 4 protein [Actinobacteria bacterium]|nr:glycosyltransferase family 4 protein [Actinomycetota bacterium]